MDTARSSRRCDVVSELSYKDGNAYDYSIRKRMKGLVNYLTER